MTLSREFRKGLWRENAVFRLLLGLCPALAVTTSAENGLGMGLATTFVLVCSNIVVSLLRKVIPPKVRIPSFIVVIASFVTVVQLCMEAYFYDLYKALGIFIPLIVVNCLILGRAEAFASKNRLVPAVVDGVGMGLGFTLALFVLGAVRELFGSGTLLGYSVFGEAYQPLILMILPPGAFIAMGLLLAGMNLFDARKQ
ncbi:MAG: electron transport complex subunit E [Desulfuromonadales bacterium]|jgi:electron transport complex protein RnfE|nr:electron transport complex subunit E [Desulfuromonadales bacterium]MDH3867909.1 electron transport complex subunit E [Desulfuromonadales bacterium]MDH4024009.1 electron transport complex subunit E [Desulfuromonadales bacterium]HKJ29575.1 electron transport complex subunit E [Desulfuromonadales bacterium]